MSEFGGILAAAATQAQAIFRELLSSDAAKPCDFVGPDGATYLCVPRAANAFDLAAVGQEMQSHGYTDKSMLVFAFQRAQFAAAPLNWRRKDGTQLSNPPKQITIVSVNTDDPFFYVMVGTYREPLAPA